MKFPGYYFYMNTNIYREIQICISVPLRSYYGQLNRRLTHQKKVELEMMRFFSRNGLFMGIWAAF